MTNFSEINGTFILSIIGIVLFLIIMVRWGSGKPFKLKLNSFLFKNFRWFRKYTIRKITDGWEVGDNMVLERDAILRMRLMEPCAPQLAGFYEDFVFIKCGNLTINMGWDDIMYNKSYMWRKFYRESHKFMGVEPGFEETLKESEDRNNSNTESTTKLDVRFLNETECKVYLDIALENEDYELADKLRKRLEELE